MGYIHVIRLSIDQIPYYIHTYQNIDIRNIPGIQMTPI